MAPGRRMRQVLLLCALAFAVVGMHQVALTPHETAHETPSMAVHAAAAMPMDLLTAQPSDGTGAGHDLMHLCLAVLCASGGLLLAWLLMAVSTGTPALFGRSQQPVWPGWRLPGPAGRSLLTSFCVLRL